MNLWWKKSVGLKNDVHKRCLWKFCSCVRCILYASTYFENYCFWVDDGHRAQNLISDFSNTGWYFRGSSFEQSISMYIYFTFLLTLIIFYFIIRCMSSTMYIEMLWYGLWDLVFSEKKNTNLRCYRICIIWRFIENETSQFFWCIKII